MLTGSFYTGLAGLQANASALNVVGNNLANINTAGFKRSQANFAQIMSNTILGIAGSGNPIQSGLGVKTTEVVAKFEQGSIATTGIKTHLAIQGEGFFMADINGTTAFTRAGNFGFNEQGQLITANGGVVQGFLGTKEDGTLDTSLGIRDIQIDLGQASPPRASEVVRFISNLSAEAPDGEPYSTTIEVYDSKGVSHQLTLTFTRDEASDVAGPPPETGWIYSFEFDGEDGTGTIGIDVVGGTGATNGDNGGVITFNQTGGLATIDGVVVQAATPALDPVINITGIPGGAAPMQVTWDVVEDNPNFDGSTQYHGSYVTNYGNKNSTGTLFQDGYGSGVLQDVDFDQNGTMIGFFDNGLTLELARVAIATFNNKNGLKQVDGGFYLPTAASGPFSVDGEGTGGRGSIISSSLESSNVDIAEEFTAMIVFQRGYQSNSRTITTVDQLLQEALNLKR